MEPEELAAIKARAARATRGPWGPMGAPSDFAPDVPDETDAFTRCLSYGPLESAPGITIGSVAHTEPIARISGYLTPVSANAAFIAHAREDVPALIAEVERLQEVVRWGLEMAIEGHERLLHPVVSREGYNYCDGCRAHGDCSYRREYEQARALLGEGESNP